MCIQSKNERGSKSTDGIWDCLMLSSLSALVPASTEPSWESELYRRLQFTPWEGRGRAGIQEEELHFGCRV